MDTKKILADLYAERKRIDAAIAALEALSTPASPKVGRPKSPQASPAPKRQKRFISAEGRKRIGEAAKKRWAAVKEAKSPAAKATAPEKKKTMSAATKRKLSVAAKARWAAKKKGAKAGSATA